MTNSTNSGGSPELQVERICNEYEQELRLAQPGLDRLQAVARQVPAPLQKECLKSLLAMDVEYRWKRNEVLSREEYATYFPGDEELVREAFNAVLRGYPPTTCTQGMAAIEHSGLLTIAQVREFFGELPPGESPPDAIGLVRRLVQAGKLTVFQSRTLLSGNGFELVRGDYVILSPIGRGGMGDVYEAVQRGMPRSVAYKMVNDNEDDALRDRFEREVSICGMLESDHIVRAYHTGEFKGTRYLVMALVEGGDLAKLVKQRGAMPGGAAIECLKHAAAGLEHSHHLGIIHRDIKPGNILWDAKAPRAAITDWGLARCLDDAPPDGSGGMPRDVRQRLVNTTQGKFEGTRGFAPPEQLQGGQCDQRSDIYALGKTLHCLLAGTKLPSEAEHLIFAGGDFVSGLDEIYRDMVAPDPEDRYQAAAELLEDLRRLQPLAAPGLESVRRWMTATARALPSPFDTAAESGLTYFTDPAPVETFIKKVVSMDVSRRIAHEKLRDTLADDERWQPDDFAAAQSSDDSLQSFSSRSP
jgi:serine/threonine protein kinase